MFSNRMAIFEEISKNLKQSMFGLDPSLTIILIVCLVIACAFEFVNGFHDTANAVATVIYTKTMKPTVAVVWSGLWNFLGVIKGGVDVAMGIVLLLPLEALIYQTPYFSAAMVLAMLISAIAWNLFTWYFGIPCSSSHTLIGAIIGVGLAFQFMPENISNATVNWGKASEIGVSLLVSPLIGFFFTIILMLIFRKFIQNKTVFEEPRDDKKPPFWVRFMLISTCTAVSYAHGNNDGQKGVGLIMVVLISFVPLQFALNQQQDIRKTAIDVNDLKSLVYNIDTTKILIEDSKKFSKAKASISKVSDILSQNSSIENLSKEQKIEVRTHIMSSTKILNKLSKDGALPVTDFQDGIIKSKSKSILNITNYTPTWVLVLISLSLGIGTMIGWKRIVVTIGEKIGKSHLTYAQGASSEMVAASTIYGASALGLPVSTTQVLTSAIAGSMYSKNGLKNLQGKTLKGIGLAWILTLPVCMILSAILFYLFRSFVV